MRTIQYVPGPIAAAPTVQTLPATAPDIDEVVSAEIERLPSALIDHTQGEVCDAILDHTQALIVDAILDHPVHQHDMTMVVPAGAGAVVTAPAAPGPIEQVGGPVTHPAAVDLNAAAQAHVVGANPVGHLVGANPLAHAGGNPVVVVTAVIRITARTFTLDVATLVGDLLTLNYQEVGERVLVS
ncbi:hypothetical protein ES703_116905 [subsurface metagenome]